MMSNRLILIICTTSSAIRNTTTNAALQQIPNHGHASLDGHCQQTPDGLKPQGSTFNPTFVHGFFLGLIVATSAWAIVWAAKRTCLSDRVPEVKQTGEEEREEQEEQENAQKPARRAFKGPC